MSRKLYITQVNNGYIVDVRYVNIKKGTESLTDDTGIKVFEDKLDMLAFVEGFFNKDEDEED